MTVEFIFIIGIVVAIIGVLSIAAVMWQSEAKPPADQPADEDAAPAANAVSAADTPPIPVIEVRFPDEPPVTLEAEEPLVTIESITASYAHANDDAVVAENSLRINVASVLANQIEHLYQEYVRLEEERTRLSEALLTNMLFEKIERSAGRLEIATERQTLDLREQFSRVSADYDRVQFRLGSLQHLNLRLDDPRVAQQLEDLVLEVKRLAQKADA